MLKTDIFSPVSPIMALVCLLIAYGTSCVIQRFAGKPLAHDRFQTIDGLRGYLAFFVFLHHASIWFYYLHGNSWQTPPSNLFTQFGQGSVAIFFMITAFLFMTKLIEARKSGLDWLYMYISRFFRLTPLYIFAMVVLFLNVGLLSRWELQEPLHKIFSELIKWLLFTFGGAPDINAVSNTAIMMAGVTWSLRYEWLFYLSLPILALPLGIRTPLLYLGVGLSLVGAAIYFWHPSLPIVRCFYGGILAAFLVRLPSVLVFAQTLWGSLTALLTLLYAFTQFESAYSSEAQFIFSVAFVLIAAGSDLFGLLKYEASKTLGEMAYSIYLLHGLLLFMTFEWIDPDYARALSTEVHWIIVMVCTVVLICLSFFTYTWIEKPCMKLAQRFRGRSAQCHLS